MAAENSPFQIEPKNESDPDTRRKYRFVSLDVPLDPYQRNVLNATHELRFLDSTKPQEVFLFMETVSQVTSSCDFIYKQREPRF
jgi:hypothetical protein